MIYIVINALAIVVATLVGMACGTAWYALIDRHRTVRFGVGQRATAVTMLLIFVAEFWFASILAGALILAPPQAGRWTMAIGSALIIWIGFIVPVLLVNHRLRGLPPRFVVMDCGHWLGVMLVQVVILQSIGLQPPGAG